MCSAVVVAVPRHDALAGAVLEWTAPGDNGSSGTASLYDIRRSTQLITDTSFATADTVAGAPKPAPAGTAQSCDVALPVPGVTYYFAIRTRDAAGNWSALSNVVSLASPTTAVRRGAPGELRFDPPWPNPARRDATLHLELPQRTDSEVEIFDTMGRHVRTLWRGSMEAGARDLQWNLRDDGGRAVASGVYFARARLGTFARTQRIVVAP